MYIFIVLMLMFVLPIVSILVELVAFHSTLAILLLVGKWFVFWAIGVRLFTAGVRQAINPQFTAEKILGIKGSQQFIIVQELGFANIAIGTLGIITILNGDWVLPAAIVGLLFLGLAGIRHAFTKERNFFENTAMLSNLIVAGILLIYIIYAVVS